MGTYGIKNGIDIDAVIEEARVVDQLAPLCFPIDLPIDAHLLENSFKELFVNLGLDYEQFCIDEAAESSRMQQLYIKAKLPFNEFIKSDWYTSTDVDTSIRPIAWDMNLNHLPGLTGKDRWAKYRGQFEHIFAQDVNPADYEVLLEEVKDSYLGNVIQRVFEYHETVYNKPFRGRASFIWINSNEGYNFHFDAPRTPIRYHVPVVTNPDCVWLFKDNDTSEYIKMHMPVGSAWQFFPVTIEHTVINKGLVPRVHLIITEVLDNV